MKKKTLLNFLLILTPIIFGLCLVLLIKDNQGSINKNLESIDSEGWEYIQLENEKFGKYIVITGYHGNEHDNISIPGTINGMDVKIIKGIILKPGYALSKLIIPKEIEEIYGHTFDFAEINEVEFEEGSMLRIIGGEESFAISKCEKLVLPDSVEEIHDEAFAYAFDLKSIYIGKNVKKIGKGAFYSTKLSDITISPENSKYSYDDGCFVDKETNTLLFYDHDKIKIENPYIRVPDYIENIDPRAVNNVARFEVDDKNPYFAVYNDCLYSKDGKILYRVPELLGSDRFSFNDQVETIEQYAFYGTVNLKEIHIPETVKTIERHAFTDQCLYVPTTMESLNLQTFYGKVFYSGTEQQWNEMTVFDSISVDGSNKRMYELIFTGDK